MKAARNNKSSIIFDLVHQAVFAIDAARPEARQAMFQRFRFAQAAERRLRDIVQKLPDFFRRFWGMFFEVSVIFKGIRRENKFHKSSGLMSMPLPASRSAIDLRKCAGLAGFPRRYMVS